MDAERGNTTHGPELDDEMKREAQGMVQGHGRPHAEPFRESEPLPDDTDDEAVQRAFDRGSPANAHDQEQGDA